MLDVKTFQKKCAERCTNDSNRKATIDHALRGTLLVIVKMYRIMCIYLKFTLHSALNYAEKI